MSYPAALADKQRKAYPELAPLDLPMTADTAFALVRKSARRMLRWKIVAEDMVARRLEAAAVTRLFQFKDDIVIEVRGNGAKSTIHMRSKSRIGKGDLGVNARRIRAFLRLLRAGR